MTNANPATTAMLPGAPRATASPVPAMDTTVTPSRCHHLVTYIPGDAGRVSPIPLSPLQGDQELLRGQGRTAHLHRMRPWARRASLREVPGEPGVRGCFLGCNPALHRLFLYPHHRCLPGYVGDPLRGEPCQGERRGERTRRCPPAVALRGAPCLTAVPPHSTAEPGVPSGQCQCDPRGSIGEGCDADGQCRCKVSRRPPSQHVPKPWEEVTGPCHPPRPPPLPPGQCGGSQLCHLPSPPFPPECRRAGWLPALLLHGHRPALRQHRLRPRHRECPLRSPQAVPRCPQPHSPISPSCRSGRPSVPVIPRDLPW